MRMLDGIKDVGPSHDDDDLVTFFFKGCHREGSFAVVTVYTAVEDCTTCTR